MVSEPEWARPHVAEHTPTLEAALYRSALIDRLLARIRREPSTAGMVQAALGALIDALGTVGAAVIDLVSADLPPRVLHARGAFAGPILPTSASLLAGAEFAPVCDVGPAGQPVLVCPSHTRFGDRVGLATWRSADVGAWTLDDHTLVSSVTAVVRLILEHEMIQREIVEQARSDPLTGLLNRRAFLEDVTRRIERLERDELCGTLMFADLDNLKSINDLGGHEAGDAALRATGRLLRDTLRPTDLVARFGGDEFAMWLDGADQLTAAERAEALRLTVPRRIAEATGTESSGLSIGIACRHVGSAEPLDSLARRADRALYEAKRAGRGVWRVSLAPIV
jgi:diguanylate cyclase (GGDEF)-like protein